MKTLYIILSVLLGISVTYSQISIVKTFTNPKNEKVFLGGKDMDGDGKAELAFCESGTVTNSFTIYDGATGTIKYASPTGTYYISGFSWGSTYSGDYGDSPFVDVDNNGKYEFVYGVYNASGIIVNILGSGPIGLSNNNNNVPTESKLNQNYPNPFNPTTTIEYEIQKKDNVKIDIYDITGSLVNTVVNETKDVGSYSVIWDGKNSNGLEVSSGAYFYQLVVGDFISTKKMIFLK